MSTVAKYLDVGLNVKEGIIQLHEPRFTINCHIRIFEVCRNSSLVLSPSSKIRRDEFFCFLFLRKKKEKPLAARAT